MDLSVTIVASSGVVNGIYAVDAAWSITAVVHVRNVIGILAGIVTGVL